MIASTWKSERVSTQVEVKAIKKVHELVDYHAKSEEKTQPAVSIYATKDSMECVKKPRDEPHQ